MLTNDDVGGVAEALRAVITNVGQLELAMVFDLLNNPPTLRDGESLFVASNTVSGQSKNLAAIDAGQAALRAQTANGAAIDAEVKTLIVPAGDEFTARALILAAPGATAPTPRNWWQAPTRPRAIGMQWPTRCCGLRCSAPPCAGRKAAA